MIAFPTFCNATPWLNFEMFLIQYKCIAINKIKVCANVKTTFLPLAFLKRLVKQIILEIVSWLAWMLRRGQI